MSDDLSKLRARIDAIDDRILRLLSERGRIARSIGHRKRGTVYRPEREAQVLARMVGANPGPVPAASIRHIYTEIMSACRAIEAPLTAAFLGPRGTYSEAATLKHFGASSLTVPCASIDEVFKATESGGAGYGVVPVENSTEGAISRTLDLLLGTRLRICGEVMLPIHHCLMARRGTKAIRRIVSHAQSLAQCHQWLNQNHPGVERAAVASNAEAARVASIQQGVAAIAGRNAADLYKLRVFAENIEDESRNTTRFLVIADQDVAPSGKDRTSLIASIPNRPGAAHELLTPLRAHGVSMSRLESRPARSGLWEYVFYIDIEGHRDDPAVSRALADMQAHATFLKVLGSYPQGAV
jgi:chorismate mutase/prephenate dehydratase